MQKDRAVNRRVFLLRAGDAPPCPEERFGHFWEWKAARDFPNFI